MSIQSWTLPETDPAKGIHEVREGLNALDFSDLSRDIVRFQGLTALYREVASYVSCKTAADVSDEEAKKHEQALIPIGALYEQVLGKLRTALKRLSSDEFDKLQKELPDIAFFLSEQHKLSKELLETEKEEMISNLSINGYHGYWSLYRTLIGSMKIEFEGETLSIGQAESLLTSPDEKIRSSLFTKWQAAFADLGDVFAEILNNIAGYRLQMYEMRGWESPLKEALFMSHMKPESLSAMYEAVSETTGSIKQYLLHKASILGREKLSWIDLQIPLGKAKDVPYEKGAEMIYKYFGHFHPPMEDFARRAIEEKWIESEDRPGKQPGGFCTSFPLAKQSRIFMTYSGTMNNLSVLAHELGHAYHSHCLNERPYFAQDYAMNVAETASMLAEMILVDGALKKADTEEEKTAILDDKLQRGAMLLGNLHARFIFETRFYEERKKGFVSKARLSEIMVEAQKKAFGEALSEYDPLFWASKMHFYFTDIPFYNFPYTFGYLLSLCVYHHALEVGADFVDAFLKDTASMSVEDLIAKHLKGDITKKDFWAEGLKLYQSDVQAFI